MRVLIVEDEFVSRRLLTRCFERVGVVDVAADGFEAIEAVKAALDDKQPYGLITLDVMMPRLDGLGALRQLRKMERAAGLQSTQCAKVLMVSALNDSRSVMTAFQDEADGFVVKPLKPDQVDETLRKLGLLAVQPIAAH